MLVVKSEFSHGFVVNKHFELYQLSQILMKLPGIESNDYQA